MHQLTIRGVDDELARRDGISLNRAALKLLRRGADPGERDDRPDIVSDSLDHLIGTWTAEEATRMDQALEDVSRIDEEMWS